MTIRLRTKFLAFPAILIVISVVLSFTALSTLRSETRLLEEFSKEDLAQNARTTILFDRLSRNHTAIYNLMTDAEQGLDGARVYEQGQPLLDNIRGVLRDVEALATTFSLGLEESRLHAALVAKLHAYV
ncbi:MAG TPA: hypothetical protein VLO07_10245, partial [Thermoanaerobaculia bacterium]|nr:hypothetical protein [Thermoanaerobaculia bacterium]